MEGDLQMSVTTPEMAVLTRLSNMYRILFVSLFIAFAWVAATAAAIYFSLTEPDGSFLQALATNALASLLLVVIAPLMFSLLSDKPRLYSIVFVVVAAGFMSPPGLHRIS